MRTDWIPWPDDAAFPEREEIIPMGNFHFAQVVETREETLYGGRGTRRLVKFAVYLRVTGPAFSAARVSQA